MAALLQPLHDRVRRAVVARGGAPGPVGDPVGRAEGPDPDRVLVLGSGPASGLGAATQQDALPGLLPRSLAARTGRGAVVEVRGAQHARLADVPELVAGARLPRFDALILVVGMVDAASGAGVRRWSRALQRQLDALQDDGARDALILLTGVPPASSVTARRPLGIPLADHRIRGINRRLQDLARTRSSTAYVALPTPSPAEPVGGAAWYHRCAEAYAAALAPGLDAQHRV